MIVNHSTTSAALASAPATGSCRWVGYDPATGRRMLEITVQLRGGPLTQVYVVHSRQGGYRLERINERFELVGYEVTAPASGEWKCSCPDAVKRGGSGCKHCRALRKALTL